MNDQPAPHSPQSAPTLTFRGGGWVIVLAVVLMMLVLAWGLLGPLLGRRPLARAGQRRRLPERAQSEFHGAGWGGSGWRRS